MRVLWTCSSRLDEERRVDGAREQKDLVGGARCARRQQAQPGRGSASCSTEPKYSVPYGGESESNDSNDRNHSVTPTNLGLHYTITKYGCIE